jgi:preprotein translocase subunit SecG
MSAVLGILLFMVSVFLILLILVQRGRGGGLTGALGGMGGQSAFGAKAGDTFTRVTMVAAAVWILLCLTAIRFLGAPPDWGVGAAEQQATQTDDEFGPLPSTVEPDASDEATVPASPDEPINPDGETADTEPGGTDTPPDDS